MKKKIAIMLTLILATGTFTACTAEEKLNNDIQTSVVSTTADVSVSNSTSEISITKQAETTTTAETESTEKAIVLQESEGSTTYPKSIEKTDVGQTSATKRKQSRKKQ